MSAATISKRLLIVSLVLVALMVPFVSAYVYSQQTQTLTHTIINMPQRFVVGLSDVDGSADQGTHSNFLAQQAGPDGNFDEVTEAPIDGLVVNNQASDGRFELLFAPVITSNYVLDLEEQWTNLDFGEANNQLCVYLESHEGSENLQVDVWYGSAWRTLLSDVVVGWNNITVSAYLDSSSLTIRFKDSGVMDDMFADCWAIDVVLLNSWT